MAEQSISWTRLSAAKLEDILRSHEKFAHRVPGGQRAMLAFHDLSGIDLSGRDLSEADMSGARLRQCRMVGAKLRMTNLFGADLRMANLERADLTRADLRGICLRGAE